MNAQPQSGQVIRSADFLVASGLLTAGSLLLLLSSIGFTANHRWLLVFAPPAIFLHFLGWNALAGWMTVPEMAGPEDPAHIRQKVFAASIAAFLAGLTLLLLVYPGSISQAPALPTVYGALVIFPLVPLVFAPVVLVHGAIFWWGSGAVHDVRPRLLVRAAGMALVTIAGVGLYVQLASPALLFIFPPLAGLTAVGYLLGALGWWGAFRRDRLSGIHATRARG